MRVANFLKTVGILGLTFLMAATAAPGKLARAAVCTSDRVFESEVRQAASAASQEVRRHLQPLEVDDLVERMRDTIDDTSLRTGGKLRDFFVGGNDIYAKQAQVEEYLRPLLEPSARQLLRRAESQAERLAASVGTGFDGLGFPEPETRGRASATIRGGSRNQNIVRSGNFRLQQRGAFFGINFDTVGRVTYTVRLTNRMNVSSTRVQAQYDFCGGSRFGEVAYRGTVSVQPVLEVQYRFRTEGRGRQRYTSFSGRFYLLEREDRIERDIDVVRSL